ncbi:sensor histidine kinase [Nocardioides daeguensis]|uniref:histidine kinase n=1 Tax=Nocardioides daeguensis TaxID=908359 RepID=A0ABP6W623_9ACTN|nr:sensor histidine kinase [Nocardioides daeguensis]MBV6727786.1 sensor histidine kinase [Nocardioides daeguensis]MCR1775258.1 sensor histidine kinase [Nocardioides daeguensis]
MTVPVPLQADTRPRGLRAVAVLVVPVLCVALVPLGAWLDMGAPETGPGPEIAGGPGWPWQSLGAALGVLAGIVLLHDPRQKFGWLLAFSGLFWALDGLSQSYVQAGLGATSAWPGMTFALWFLLRFSSYLTSVTAVTLLVFPTGRFLPGRWTPASWCAVAAMALSGVAFIVVPSEGDEALAGLPPGVDADPTTLGLLAGHEAQVSSLGLALGAAGFVFSLLTVVVRYRRSEGLERDRMRWLLWSVVVIVAVVAVTVAVDVPGSTFLGAVSAALVPPAAMTVAIVRPTLVPIQDLLSRTVVLAAILAVLVAADAAVLGMLTLVLDDELTQAQVVAVVLVVCVFLYGPLRQRLSAGIRRVMLGERGNRYDAVAGLASTLENTDDTVEQLAAVARAVASAFAVPFVSVEVDRGHGERLVTTFGERPAEVRTLPITWRETTIGRLVLPAKGLRSRLTVRDEELLGDLVRQAATAARTSQLAEEVQRSRERLVTAREEERRRIRRDLHDGFGPALSGIVFQLEAARMTVDRDPARARAQLETISSQVQEVVADVRRLVHDLRPPALDDRGLVGALRQQAEHLAVPLAVTAPDDLRLPAAVEVAAYRIAGEALTNVARHAGAHGARLLVETAGDTLVLEVADDGRGIPVDRAAGVGLASLRERAAELGGTTTISSPPGGGTVVRARLPLRSPA